MTTHYYEELDTRLQAYLHTLELREYFHAVRQITGCTQLQALEIIQTNLFGAGSTQWQQEIKTFLLNVQPRADELRDLVPYYLVAGCGIARICQFLQVGQAYVYEVRDTLPTRNYDYTATPVFWDEPATVHRLQEMIAMLNIMDHFRVRSKRRARHNPFGTGTGK